jgi:hypothetical protein
MRAGARHLLCTDIARRHAVRANPISTRICSSSFRAFGAGPGGVRNVTDLHALRAAGGRSDRRNLPSRLTLAEALRC